MQLYAASRPRRFRSNLATIGRNVGIRCANARKRCNQRCSDGFGEVATFKSMNDAGL